MKLSTIIKSVGQILFWMSLVLIISLIQPQCYAAILCSLGIGLLWVLLFLARKYRILHFPAFSHMIAVAVVAGIQSFTGAMSWQLNVVFGILILLSFIAATKQSEFICEPNPVEIIILTLILFIDYVGDFGHENLLLAWYGIFLFCYFYGTVQTNYEDEIERLDTFSHVDAVTLQKKALLPPLIGCLAIAALCLGLSFLGRLPVFGAMQLGVKNYVLGIYRYIVQGIREPIDSTTGGSDTTETPIIPSSGNLSDAPDPVAYITGIIFILLLVGLIVWAVVTKLREPKELTEEYGIQERFFTRKPSVGHKNMREKRTADYHIRRNMRRVYAKRVRKGRGTRNDDLVARTPEEHRILKQREGVELTQNFVAFYEKARYSEDTLTKEDLKNMIKEPDRIPSKED